MAKNPDELLALAKPWGIEEEVKKYLQKYLHKKGEIADIDSWIRDRRTAAQFAEQMLAYWAVEDAFATWLENNLKRKYPEVKVLRSGTDKDREIVQGQAPRGKVTGEPDYHVDFGEDSKKIPVEFQFAAVELDAYDIKKNKINKAEKQQGVILFVFLPIEKFTIITPGFVKKFGEDYTNPRLGGKQTWNIKKEKIVFKDKEKQITKEDLVDGF